MLRHIFVTSQILDNKQHQRYSGDVFGAVYLALCQIVLMKNFGSLSNSVDEEF